MIDSNGYISEMDELTIHQKRREQSIPAISVLCGNLESCSRIWENHSRLSNPLVIRIFNPTYSHTVEKMISAMRERKPLIDYLMDWVSDRGAVHSNDLRFSLFHRSLEERKLYLNNIYSGIPHTFVDERCIDFLVCSLEDLEKNRFEILILPDLCKTFSFLHQLLKQDHAILHFVSRDESVSFQESVADFLSQVAERFPQLTLGWSLRRKAWNDYMEYGKENRAKAICRETVIDLTPPSDGRIQSTIVEIKKKNTSVDQSLHWLSKEGTNLDLAEELRQTVQALESNNDDGARSHAERFLFSCLESQPETTGSFVLNRHIPIPFGNRKTMEIDLLSEEFQLALEIDGYFHFQHQNNYRRDRQKDYLLQKHGYCVMRFLAADVVERLEEVLHQITDYIRGHNQYHSNQGNLL